MFSALPMPFLFGPIRNGPFSRVEMAFCQTSQLLQARPQSLHFAETHPAFRNSLNDFSKED